MYKAESAEPGQSIADSKDSSGSGKAIDYTKFQYKRFKIIGDHAIATNEYERRADEGIPIPYDGDTQKQQQQLLFIRDIGQPGLPKFEHTLTNPHEKPSKDHPDSKISGDFKSVPPISERKINLDPSLDYKHVGVGAQRILASPQVGGAYASPISGVAPIQRAAARVGEATQHAATQYEQRAQEIKRLQKSHWRDLGLGRDITYGAGAPSVTVGEVRATYAELTSQLQQTKRALKDSDILTWALDEKTGKEKPILEKRNGLISKKMEKKHE